MESPSTSPRAYLPILRPCRRSSRAATLWYVLSLFPPFSALAHRALASQVVTSKLTTTITANIIKSWKDDLAAHEADTPRVRIISCPVDRQQWEPLAAKGVPIYSVEAVFHSVMKQNFDGFVKGNRIDQQL